MISQRGNPSWSHLSSRGELIKPLPLLLLASVELLACLNMVKSSLSILNLCNGLHVSQHPVLGPPAWYLLYSKTTAP